MTTQHSHTTIDNLYDVLFGFDPISLEDLNATMSLMERIESKYLLTLDDLGPLIKSFQKDYYVLSINNNSIFTYDNIYMDTSDFLFFQLHEKNSKKRTKIRTREYVESDLAFFEFKQREGDLVSKSRFKMPVQESKDITAEGKTFYQSMCANLDLPYSHRNLMPSLRTLYKRITLCSKNNDERITIDFDIHVENLRKNTKEKINLGPIAIIETKANKKDSASNRILTKMKYNPVSGCSKYCLGLLTTGMMSETKHFKNSMKFISKANKESKKIKKITSQKLETTKETIEKQIEHHILSN